MSRERGKAPTSGGGFSQKKSGDVLLSQEDSLQVPSALVGLTSVFGMGTGVAPPLWSPKTRALDTREFPGAAGGRQASP